MVTSAQFRFFARVWQAVFQPGELNPPPPPSTAATVIVWWLQRVLGARGVPVWHLRRNCVLGGCNIRTRDATSLENLDCFPHAVTSTSRHVRALVYGLLPTPAFPRHYTCGVTPAGGLARFHELAAAGR